MSDFKAATQTAGTWCTIAASVVNVLADSTEISIRPRFKLSTSCPHMLHCRRSPVLVSAARGDADIEHVQINRALSPFSQHSAASLSHVQRSLGGKISDLTPAQISGLAPLQISGLTPLQISGLTPQISVKLTGPCVRARIRSKQAEAATRQANSWAACLCVSSSHSSSSNRLWGRTAAVQRRSAVAVAVAVAPTAAMAA